jgi:hypothetical protein
MEENAPHPGEKDHVASFSARGHDAFKCCWAEARPQDAAMMRFSIGSQPTASMRSAKVTGISDGARGGYSTGRTSGTVFRRIKAR